MLEIKVVVAKTKGNVTLETEKYDENTLPEDHILIKSDYSVISAGTECAWISGNSNNSGASFPFYPGYSVSGHVVKVGKNVKNYVPGDRVTVPWGGHRSYTVAPAAEVWTGAHKITDDRVSLKDAALVNIASFAMLGVRKLMIQMGESVMIAGLGLLGQVAVQAARISGAAPLLVSDFSPERRELAMKFGADYAFDPRDPEYFEKIMDVTGGKGVAASVEVTGQAIALKQALKYAAPMGRVSLLGCIRVPDCQVDFYRDVQSRGITIVSADTCNRPKAESQPGMWTEHDDYETILKFLASGRFQFAPLFSQVISPEECTTIYRTLLETKQQPLGIVYDWTKIS